MLARRNYSEADRILMVYSQHYGKVGLMAKGVRRPKSRKRGSLEVFSHIRFSAARGKNLDVLTEVEMIDSYEPIRNNLKRSVLAYYFIEVVGKTMREDEKNSEVYGILLHYLKQLEQSRNLRDLKNKFISKILVSLGFWPKGKKMVDHDRILTNIIERQLTSSRVGRKVLL